MKSNSLYIHIPFCQHICAYCDFPKVLYHQQTADEYLENLKKEIETKKIADKRYQTIYIGGGTPSVLNKEQLTKLLELISPFLDVNQEYEFTIEANPNDIVIEKLFLFKKYKINRISLGVQTFNNRLLSRLGRDHNKDTIRFAIEMIKYAGFNNFSVDLIYGIPGQSRKSFLKDIAILIKQRVPHISLYSLVVESNTVFNNKKVEAADDHMLRKMYDGALQLLRKHFYTRYEVSNFALPGQESRHNLNYWRANNYDALGLGAHQYYQGVRRENFASISKYNNGIINYKDEVLAKSDLIEEYIMLTLRLEEGISFEEFHKRFDLDFPAFFAEEIDKLLRRGLIQRSSSYLKATDEGIMLLDQIILTLITKIKEDI